MREAFENHEEQMLMKKMSTGLNSLLQQYSPSKPKAIKPKPQPQIQAPLPVKKEPTVALSRASVMLMKKIFAPESERSVEEKYE